MDFDGIFNHFSPRVGQWGGDYFSIQRPNYAQVDNTPVILTSSIKYRADGTGSRFPEPYFAGVSYYDIFGSRTGLQPGDMLFKVTPDGMTPPMTILSYMTQKAMVGMRTSRVCDIANSIDDPELVYHNVYFDFLGIGYPGSYIEKKIEDSMKIPSTKAVMFRRPGITRLRTHLIETDYNVNVTRPDGTVQPLIRKWQVMEIDFSGDQMVLTVSNV